MLDAFLVWAGLLCFFSPPWHIFWAWTRVPEFGQTVEVRRAVALLAQVEHPLAPISDSIHRILQWRLLFPGAAHILHLPSVVLLALPFIGAVLAIWTILWIARREGLTRAEAAWVAIVLGATGWFFASTAWLGYFDSWLVVALLLTTYARDWRTVLLMCLLAPWVDERFVIALPLALFTRWWQAHAAAGTRWSGEKRIDGRLLIGAVVITGSFLLVRLSLSAGSGSMGLLEYLRNQQTLHIGVGRHLLGLAAGLRFAWPLVLVAVGLAWFGASRRVALGLIVGVSVTVLVSMLIANDLSRSTSILIPVTLAGALEGARRKVISLRWGYALAALALLVPAWHVVTDFSLRIERLPTVVQSFRHPMGSLAPLNWVKTAEQFVAQGNPALALRHLDVALRLDAQCGAAYNVRGFIAFQRADWETARTNFAQACRFSAQEPSYWLHYAYTAWKLQDNSTYQLAIAEAKRLSAAGSDIATKIAALEALVANPG